MNRYFLAGALLIMSLAIVKAQPFQLKRISVNSTASFRSLSVVNDKVVWIGGTNGSIGLSTDGGKNWNFSEMPGHEKADFRSLYAFDDKSAIIANAGSPASIMITNDGGKSWKTVYTNNHESAFIDGIDFWNDKEGLIYGDPIEGKMLLLKTDDGGQHWKEVVDRPTLSEGEASFAASGTGIRCLENGNAIITTGGVVSRLWVSENKGMSWSSINPPIVQGENTTGIYSFAKSGANIILVGGDYTKPAMATKHNLYSNDNGNSWLEPKNASRGYRECVEFITPETLITAGPTGIDISYDLGKNWEAMSEETGFHVVRKARQGSLTILAGGNGQITILTSK